MMLSSLSPLTEVVVLNSCRQGGCTGIFCLANRLWHKRLRTGEHTKTPGSAHHSICSFAGELHYVIKLECPSLASIEQFCRQGPTSAGALHTGRACMWLAGAEPALTPLVARSRSVKPGILDMMTAVSYRQAAAADQAPGVIGTLFVNKWVFFPFLDSDSARWPTAHLA